MVDILITSIIIIIIIDSFDRKLPPKIYVNNTMYCDTTELHELYNVFKLYMNLLKFQFMLIIYHRT